MAKSTKSETVPQNMQPKFTEISQLTDAFCDSYLNSEYAQLARFLNAALCRKRPSPLSKGKAKTWAAGIIHALGMVNFLFDSSQTPHVKATFIYEYFEIGQSTGQGKSKQIRDLMKMRPMDVNWCLPSLIDSNPMAWMISVDGFIIDARHAPRVIQEAAFAKGLIPYLREDEPID